ncbi:MAG TPA: hypothetical protein VER97_07545 [Geodermatophilus sp.]|nr:hypothetical protein [Geodermatophilus sp.]
MRTTTVATLRWAATALAFPVGGLLSRLPGPVDSPAAALLAGAVAGGVLGLAHGLALGRRTALVALSSAAGLAAGLAVGGALVGWDTTPGALAVQGLVSGAAVGTAQYPALIGPLGARAALWPLVTAAAWSLGWLTTAAAGVDVERQYAVFGATGAVVATALTGLLAVPALRRRVSA